MARTRARAQLNTRDAAAAVDMTPAGFRRAMHRLRAEGVDFRLPEEAWPDLRTPLWDEAGLREWHAGRRRRPKTSS